MLQSEIQVTNPIVVNLGKQGRKQIKALRRGRGKLMDEVMDVTEQVQRNLGDQANGKILVPIVVVYSKKRKPTGLLG